jgi:hypothetical protein
MPLYAARRRLAVCSARSTPPLRALIDSAAPSRCASADAGRAARRRGVKREMGKYAPVTVIPPLQQMSGFARPRIEAAETPMRFADRARQPIARRGRQNEVNVVGHRPRSTRRRVLLLLIRPRHRDQPWFPAFDPSFARRPPQCCRGFVQTADSDLDIVRMKFKQPRSADWAKAAALVGFKFAGRLEILDAPLGVGDEDAAALLPARRAMTHAELKCSPLTV